MARTKKAKEEKEEKVLETNTPIQVTESTPEITLVVKSRPELITHEFGNGDINVLRDKINEIIKHLS